MCQGAWVEEIHVLVVQGFLSPGVLKKMYPSMGCSDVVQAKRLEIHLDVVASLIAKRSMSILAQFLRPPQHVLHNACCECYRCTNHQKTNAN